MNEKEAIYKAAEAFDAALAATVKAEFHRLSTDYPNMMYPRKEYWDAHTKLEEKFRSWEMPEYEDKWVVFRYIIKYQARQVNLIQAVLRGSAPESHSEILNVIDVGSGAWASLIAYTIYCFVEDRWDPKTVTHFHMIEPNGHMTQLGEKLWLEFGRAARDMGLKDLQDIIEAISVKHHTSFDNGYVPNMRSGPNTELWILSAHALYGGGDLCGEKAIYDQTLPNNYNKLSREYLKYEMITSDGKKKHLVHELVPQLCKPEPAGYLEVSKGKLYALEESFNFHNLLILNKDNSDSPAPLKKTTDMVRSKLKIDKFDVEWLWRANPIYEDAIWVWPAPE